MPSRVLAVLSWCASVRPSSSACGHRLYIWGSQLENRNHVALKLSEEASELHTAHADAPVNPGANVWGGREGCEPAASQFGAVLAIRR